MTSAAEAARLATALDEERAARAAAEDTLLRVYAAAAKAQQMGQR